MLFKLWVIEKFFFFSSPHSGNQFDLPGYHGKDGLGDAKDIKDPDLSLIKQKHAVGALVQLATEHAGHLNIAALGPLTNIALACRMDPAFGKNIKSLSAMGGNKHGKGNHWVSAEFNFGADPEAAHVVLKEMKCHVSLITWELCLEHTMEWDFFYEYVGKDTPKSRFMKKISSTIQEYEAGGPFLTCDPFVVSVIVEPEMVRHGETIHAVVELSGQNTRGQLVVDWRGVLGKQHNVVIIDKIDLDIFKRLMLKSIQ